MNLEIEIDGPHNEQLHFRPLRRSIRGRFEWARVNEPQARIKAATEPPVIPGQRIGWDGAKLYVADGLHDAQHAAVKERIERQGYRLPPAREEFDVDEATALYWIARAVESGFARVVSGKLPAKLTGEPQKDFLLKREPSQTDRLTAAIERQNNLMAQLLERLAK